MKKGLALLITCLLSLIALAQEQINNAFYIYRNDGQFNAFFRDEIDSITYSNYGTDSLLYDEIVTQVVYTQDSIYQIPLAAIDSIGFVTPDIIYREGSVPLTGDLFSFLIKSNGLELIFDGSLPTHLMPQIGEKLVSTEITDKLPYCFVGQVKQVSFSGEGIKVLCDNIGLEDAVSQFYGVYDIVVGKNGEYMARGPQKARTSTDYPYDLPFGRIKLPPIGLSTFVTEKDIFGIKSDINYSNTLEVTFTPQIHIKVTRVIDDIRFLSHTNLKVVTNADVETKFDISGEAAVDSTRPWKASFLPNQNFHIPPGIPLYYDIGIKASLSGKIATGFTINSHIHQITDITYYDAALIPMIGNILSPIVNRVDGSIDITTMDMTWDYFGAEVELKPCAYIRVGISALSHVIGWVGGEFEAGLKLNGKLIFDFNRLLNAEPNTAVYEELENVAQIDIKPYIGAYFVAAVDDDRYSFRVGNDFDTPLGTWYQGRILPKFSNTKATLLSNGKAKIEADITNDCFIPYTVGFALYDENGCHVKTELNEEKYWTRHAFPSYYCEFDGLEEDKVYKAYPIIRFFDKYDMHASPSVDLDMSIESNPVAITGDYSNVTKNSAIVSCTYENVPEDGVCRVEYTSSGGGSGKIYAGSSNGTHSITLSDLEPGTNYTYRASIETNEEIYYGETKTFKTKEKEESNPELTPVAITGNYSNVTKNSAIVSCTYENVPEGGVCRVEYTSSVGSGMLYVGNSNGTYSITLGHLRPGVSYTYHAYIEANGQTYYGEDKSFTTEPKDPQTTYSGCPDENHPHWIDLGLPSGTLWSCCNAGASSPEEIGTYYTFKQIESGQVPNVPSKEQIEELIEYTHSSTSTWMGVKGVEFVDAPNFPYVMVDDSHIFIPGFSGGGGFNETVYWSSTIFYIDNAGDTLYRIFNLSFWGSSEPTSSYKPWCTFDSGYASYRWGVGYSEPYQRPVRPVYKR